MKMLRNGQKSLTDQPNQRRGLRRWFRFSLRSLLVVVTLVCVLLATWIIPSDRQRRLANQIEALKGRIYFTNEIDDWPQERSDYEYATPEQSSSPWYYHYLYSVERVWTIDQEEVIDWTSFPRLKHLILLRHPERSFSFNELNNSESLISLKLLGWIRALNDVDPSRLPHLESLAIDSEINVEVLNEVTKFKTLKHFAVECSRFPDEGISILLTLPQLQSLEIRDNPDQKGKPTVYRFDQLSKLSSLNSLKVAAKLIDDDIIAIGNLRNLEKLHLFGYPKCLLSDRSIQALANLVHLKEIVFECQIEIPNQTNLAPLQALTNLEVFRIGNHPWSTDFFEAIGKMSKLKSLELNSEGLSSAKARSLRDLQHLEEIDFTSAEVDEAAIRDLLGLKKLKLIRVFGTKFSDATVQEFKRQGVTIDQIQGFGGGTF